MTTPTKKLVLLGMMSKIPVAGVIWQTIHYLPQTLEFLEPHSAFFTFAEHYGAPGCRPPVTDRFTFHPTRQPVVMDFWQDLDQVPSSPEAFTTVGNWKQPWQDVTFQGETY